ncbi:hypothetical protein HRI_003956600 [Hibiscus trionum]|uniref:RING-type domain-containing protein n=1 Tax=Hibiscus trionum TaxID=183268 RepID=A0A9W7MI82_HIBTR|nr:hypothetical protein HRI_003956600 [Hibiscus trionum]
MAIDKLGKYLFSLLPAVSALAWAWDFLLRHSLFPCQTPAAAITAGEDSGDEEVVECAICLCKIDEDDEIPELRCDHLFHKVCLDRWAGYRRFTCPICRVSLTPRRLVSGMEVILFKYCNFGDSGHRETWWLR